MSVKSRTISPLPAQSPPREEVLSLFLALSPVDQNWLTEQLARLPPWKDGDGAGLPESATLDEAIDLFLADKCSLGRAAELAGVTRWDIQDVLKERGIPIVIHTDMTAEEMDQVAEELEREGLLC